MVLVLVTIPHPREVLPARDPGAARNTLTAIDRIVDALNPLGSRHGRKSWMHVQETEWEQQEEE